ncbi:RNA methyltransferase, TrmA family [Prosthecochloris aestuarii DSM 271]|uniref:RNA methyltransferase, TrmA family n=3 Tax=Prosthecochloris TaxID=1101 RepID=B4S6W8_PROA2|nr:23S rRNA (uracil(1939)-C(5))-methyltransferase RlmD [Prosthecochloris aestuarii]ACF47323.1 RNA methyltransferase, TrmA family [Prosthecochloris aestuarii DSM 271]
MTLRDIYRKGELVELTIADIAEKDQCFGTLDNGAGVLVRGMLAVGDRVSAKVLKVKPRYLEAVLDELLEPSEDRVEPVCSVFGVCGGCKWMHVSYDAQLHYKKKKVADALEHIGGMHDIAVQPVLPAPEAFHYRNKVEFSCSSKRYLLPHELSMETLDKSKDFALGFHAPGNFEKVLEIDTCYLAKPSMNEALSATRAFALDRGLEPYAARAHTGFLRNLMLRYSEEHDELMVNIVTSWYDRELMEAYRDHLLERMKGRRMTIVNNVTTRKNTVSTGEKEYVVYGDGTLRERLGDLHFRISANSFFQTNTRQAEALYEGIMRMAGLKQDDVVYDLYCGTGTITLYLAERCRQAVGLEVVESSIIDAAENAGANGIENAAFYQVDLKDFHTLVPTLEQYGMPRVIVTDPPRAGMHPKALETLLRLQPETIVYVSCNPANLARDGKEIVQQGYRLEEVQPVDMFPHTSHVETLACFRRTV